MGKSGKKSGKSVEKYGKVGKSREKSGFPQGLENRENREQNNGQGKVREFYFGPKVREKSGNFVLSCRLPCKFAVILVDYRECLSRYSPI